MAVVSIIRETGTFKICEVDHRAYNRRTNRPRLHNENFDMCDPIA